MTMDSQETPGQTASASGPCANCDRDIERAAEGWVHVVSQDWVCPGSKGTAMATPRESGPQRLRLACALVGAAGIVWGAIAMWWWALAGMGEHVGAANAITAGTLAFTGIAAATFPGWPK